MLGCLLKGVHMQGRRLRVIVVLEEEPPSSWMLTQILSRNVWYHFLSLCNLDEVLEIAKSFRPDLFLFDKELPELNGYELALRLHEKKGLATVPVLVRADWHGEEVPVFPHVTSMDKKARYTFLLGMIESICGDYDRRVDHRRDLDFPWQMSG
jgi:hypothetical protein